MSQILTFLLFPFSLLYGLITAIRNLLFDKQLILKTKHYDKPIICVGNLSVGGTGKTPMVEFLIQSLRDKYPLAVLSRGYGRKTKGYFEVKDSESAQTVGDEPFQLYQKFKRNIRVFVCEDRVKGLDLIYGSTATELVILDDALQHRYVAARVSILLTAYDGLFYDDYILPAGRLRESRAGAQRADVVVVTKCPDTLTESEKEQIRNSILKYTHEHVPVFFSRIMYSDIVQVQGSYEPQKPILLLTGIANPSTLIRYVADNYVLHKSLEFPDHHSFTDLDIENIVRQCKAVSNSYLLTTEKDFQRLQPHLPRFDGLSLGYIPIKFDFLGIEADFLDFLKSKL